MTLNKKQLKTISRKVYKTTGYVNPMKKGKLSSTRVISNLAKLSRDMAFIKPMINAEKEIYTAHSVNNQAISPTAPYFAPIDNIVEGTSASMRDGESVKLHGFRWNLRFSQQTSAQGPQFIKIYLVKYIGPRGSTPNINTFLKTDFDGNYSFHSERNEDHYKSYIVIKSLTAKIQADTVSGLNMYNVQKAYGLFKKDAHQRYSGSAATTLLTDQIYIIATASNGTIGLSSACTFDSQLLISFYDN